MNAASHKLRLTITLSQIIKHIWTHAKISKAAPLVFLSPSNVSTFWPKVELLSFIECVYICVSDRVRVFRTVCTNVCACLTPFFANTMPQVVMYISCFVGPLCTLSLSSHQTFILQKCIYISRDPAQPNLVGANTSPSLSRYHSLRMFHVLVWLFSSLPYPPHTHLFVLILFC